jgi:hypothetical protein
MTEPSYEHNDPKGWCGDPRRGAALGRGGPRGDASTFTGTLYVKYVGLDPQGYDRLGTYWGDGKPIFWVADENNQVEFTFRAEDMQHALNRAASRAPNATIKEGAAIVPQCGVSGCKNEHDDITCDCCGFKVCSDHYIPGRNVDICTDCEESHND